MSAAKRQELLKAEQECDPDFVFLLKDAEAREWDYALELRPDHYPSDGIWLELCARVQHGSAGQASAHVRSLRMQIFEERRLVGIHPQSFQTDVRQALDFLEKSGSCNRSVALGVPEHLERVRAWRRSNANLPCVYADDPSEAAFANELDRFVLKVCQQKEIEWARRSLEDWIALLPLEAQSALQLSGRARGATLRPHAKSQAAASGFSSDQSSESRKPGASSTVEGDVGKGTRGNRDSVVAQAASADVGNALQRAGQGSGAPVSRAETRGQGNAQGESGVAPRNVRRRLIHNTLSEDAPRDLPAEWKEFTPSSIDPGRCMGRTWNNGQGGQCPHPRKIADLCKAHNKGLACGRVDGEIPAKKLLEFRQHHSKAMSKIADRPATSKH